MAELKRVFLGIDLSKELKQKVKQLKHLHYLSQLPIKLVEPDNSHIAIKFLDKLNSSQIEQIIEIVKDFIADTESFKVNIKNILIFPHLLNPRVLTLKVESKTLDNLGQELIKKLEGLEFVIKENRPYAPHITLGRINSHLSKNEIDRLIKIKFEEQEKVGFLTLFESQLSSTGPTYLPLARFDLKKDL